MTGQASWLHLMILLGGLGGLAVLVLSARAIASRFNWRVERVTCPRHQVGTDVLVKVEPSSGRRVDIERCALLDDPNHVDCDKACLHGQGARSGAA